MIAFTEKSPALNSKYWDCECDTHYIHRARYNQCPKCSAVRQEMPDSRQSEIDAGVHFYSRNSNQNYERGTRPL